MEHSEAILRRVSAEFGVQRQDLFAPTRGRRETAWARQVAMFLCVHVHRASFSEVGRLFGRDRTTVGHAFRLVESLTDGDDLDKFIESVRTECLGRTAASV